jgi:hypothetical protein
MDKIVNTKGLRSKSAPPVKSPGPKAGRPKREEAEAAVRTLIRWAGDDPDREGLLATPSTTIIRAITSSALSRRPAATTRWSCCATFVSSRIASIT